MRIPELEKEILDYMEEIYNAKFIGRIEVNHLPSGYQLLLGIPNPYIPTTISSTYSTGEEEEFLKYIKNELQSRNYMRREVYRYTREKKIR